MDLQVNHNVNKPSWVEDLENLWKVTSTFHTRYFIVSVPAGEVKLDIDDKEESDLVVKKGLTVKQHLAFLKPFIESIFGVTMYKRLKPIVWVEFPKALKSWQNFKSTLQNRYALIYHNQSMQWLCSYAKGHTLKVWTQNPPEGRKKGLGKELNKQQAPSVCIDKVQYSVRNFKLDPL